MGLIQKQAEAVRLARAIIANIVVENQPSFDAGADLSAEIAAGRELYRSRTIASLHAGFEEALDGMKLGRYVAR